MTTSAQVVDGVSRAPPTGITVIVVGGGVGGLGAALELWRKGSDVVVLERSESFSSIGDYFTLPPSSICNLKYYPKMFEEYHTRVYNCTTSLWSPSGKTLFSRLPEWRRGGPDHPARGMDVSFLNQRPWWNNLQLKQLERLGVPVHYGSQVVRIDEDNDKVTCVTASGKTYEGDLCIIANGVDRAIEGGAGTSVKVQDSGYAVARVAFPASTIKPGSPASALLKDVKEHPDFRVYVGKDIHLILFLTPDNVAWVFTHKNEGTAEESWNNLRDAEELLPELYAAGEDWDPAVIDFLKQTPKKVVDWQLKWRDSEYQWTSKGGRQLRLGDAAHAFFPTSGNGAVQALEDGMSIAECLRIAGKDNVPDATRVHNELRFERTSILQQAGFANREELHTVDLKALAENPNDPRYSQSGFFKLGRWVWGHDAEAYARDNYQAALSALKEGKHYKNTNIPPGHVYQPWSLESEYKRMAAGERSTLKENGYWGL